ncbi:MAG TPA: hypothetical protein VEC01_00850 [Noviherbaspirillum sp.]|uniref:hypothetical protein n=1 Tax=Noviherbaspirillum sp. TaxID=1926288 RepID=UPI002D44EF09|nr:hypothetical protein [Noviherbaspirillum sp.]HYD93841.1 hypothetical protein [Noviherbaspirillum sp.]
MTNFYTIRTDIWLMSLPSDWEERRTPDGKSLYFECKDGTKGLYIATWSLSEDDGRSAEDIAGSFKTADLKALDAMEGYAWKIVEQVNRGSGQACVAITDCLAAEKCYRSLGKILAMPPVVVKASFHDYACVDYAASQAYFAPIVDSLRFYVPGEEAG